MVGFGMTKRMQAASKLLYALSQSRLLTLSILEAAWQNLKCKNLSLYLRFSACNVFIFGISILSALSASIRFANDEAASPRTPLESVRFRLTAWSTKPAQCSFFCIDISFARFFFVSFPCKFLLYTLWRLPRSKSYDCSFRIPILAVK